MGVLALSSSDSIISSEGSKPEAYHVLKLSSPAMGTPMKFTRSLLAKAMARAKVPYMMMTLNTFTFLMIKNIDISSATAIIAR